MVTGAPDRVAYGDLRAGCPNGIRIYFLGGIERRSVGRERRDPLKLAFVSNLTDIYDWTDVGEDSPYSQSTTHTSTLVKGWKLRTPA